MEFRVLGPVECYADDGVRLGLGPPKQRAVLALLLAEPGQVVPVDRLVSALWDDAPPKTALKNLQVYVYQLRKVVGSRLESRPPGYLMSVGPAELDLIRFTELLDIARQERTPQRYREALALWRGPALADLASSGLLGGVVAQLEELRLAARVECAEAELDLGRHGEIVADLTEWVREHPLNERLREQQMLALHRAGRPAEALSAYLECRRVLLDELGVEPGESLRRLQAEILRAKPVGAAAIRQLPPDVVPFFGRSREMGLVKAQLRQDGVAVCVITGQAGAGKSALAVRAAHEIAPGFPDGQLYADLSDGASDRVLSQFLRALGERPGDEEVLRYRSLTASRRLLVVLDNVASTSQVKRLLPTGSGSVALITSRLPLASLHDASHVKLGALPLNEALQLLEGVAGEVEDAAELVRWCGGLPLALRIAGAQLAARPQWTAAFLASRLADETRRLGLGDVAVRSAFEVSYAELRSPAAARVFRLLGLVDGPDFSVAAARALTDVPDVGELLAELAGAHLVEEPVPGRFALHDLLRVFARERCRGSEASGEREPALERLHKHYLEALSDTPSDLWLAEERDNLIAAAHQASPADAIAFAAGLSWYFRRRSEVADWAAVNVLALEAARSLGDVRAEAQALKELGAACERGFRFAEAQQHWTEALALARSLHDRRLEAVTLNNLGIVHWRRRDLPAAVASLEASLTLREELDDAQGAAYVRTNLGLVHAALGDLPAALACYEETLTTLRACGDRSGELHALANMADAHRRLGSLDRALERAEEALPLARSVGDRQVEAGVLLDLGIVHELAGRVAEARASYAGAVELSRRIGFRWGESEASRKLAALPVQ
ncbi:AfsR/SARP family transcriptional regulator [Lentzea sp.]|uniref:AfsR/SARP family transcriptional regulator n=1 Tax=Lentzea sp. TaxID=56099 RepID=UPI002CE79165|nr:BTAD domain-containing putative transcriptional regulator [Lentzea sp.]HUQ61173.1 BTAD domain-containing putative transcriptional regulator [Lentzea sp.]